MKLTSAPCRPAPSISTRVPSRASITTAAEKTSPTRRLPSSAPAKPTDCTSVGRYKAITASAARRAASRPIPPHTTTISSRSKKMKLRPSYRCSTRFEDLVSPRTSRSSAATMATLGISVGPEPLDCTAQGTVGWHRLPSHLSFRLIGAGPHFLFSHADGFDRRAGLAAQQAAGDRFIHRARPIGNKIGQLHLRRGQAGDRAQLIQNLLQCQVLAAQNVALAALALFQRSNVSASAFANIHQVQSGLHIGGKLPL